MIDVHLVSWNRPKMTELVVRTLARNTKRPSYRLTVLDNGSGPDTIKMLEHLQDNGLIDEICSMPENKGLEFARQHLLEDHVFKNARYFVCLDNDCLPPPMSKITNQDWVDRLVDLMEKYENYAAISMRTQVMIGTGNIFEEADKTGADIVDFPHPGGSYRIMDVRAVRQVKGWDRDEPGRGAEERYICGKLGEAGYKTAFSTNVRCLHLFGTRGNDPTDRWGYDPSWKPEATGHSDIWHPALSNGDDKEEVSLYAGDANADRYFEA